jgi:hypothetical protein
MSCVNPGKKIDKTARNVLNPGNKLEIDTLEPPCELIRPFGRRHLRGRTVQERDRPRGEDPQHDRQAGEVSGVNKEAPVFRLPQNGKHDRVKKYEMDWAFR